jgi:hypothetical protein
MSAKRKWTILFITVAILILYPFQTTVVPEQRALFVTNDMHPIKGALIRQNWQNYSLERRGHREDVPTDAHGRVTFPRRTMRAPLIWRALGPLASVAGQGVHAGFGVHTDIFPVPGSGDTIVYTEVAQPREHVFR